MAKKTEIKKNPCNIQTLFKLYKITCVLILILVFFIGCSTVNPKKISEFKSALNKTNKEVARSLQTEEKIRYGINAENFVRDETRFFDSLIIKKNADNDNIVQEPEEIILSINHILDEYATVIERIVLKDLNSEEEFAVNCKNLDSSLRKTIGDTTNTRYFFPTDEHFNAMLDVIDGESPSDLRFALEGNQPAIDLCTTHCQKTLYSLIARTKNIYLEKAEALKNEWEKASNENLKKQIHNKILEMDGEYQKLKEMLGFVSDYYLSVSRAHAILCKSIENKAFLHEIINKIKEINENIEKIRLKLESEKKT